MEKKKKLEVNCGLCDVRNIREEVLAAMRAAVVAGPCEPVAPVRPDDLPAP